MTGPADAPAMRLEQEALRLARLGQLPAALAICRVLNTEYPRFAPGLATASAVALQLAAPAEALQLSERALALAPGDGRAWVQKARALHALGRHEEALQAAARTRAAAATDPASLDALGTLYSHLGEQRLALEAYERALALAPGNPGVLFNRAVVRRFLGQLEEAESDYDAVIRARPQDYEAYKNRTDLRTQTRERNHIAALEQCLRTGIRDWQGEVGVRYALAKEYEDVGEYAASWAQLAAGAQLRRRHLRYDVALDVATVGWIIAAFAQAPPPSAAAETHGPAPIFIVGLPRSGSTLIERILGSHPQVHPAGELGDFARAIVAACERDAGRPLPREQLVARSVLLDFAALGRDYLARVGPHAGSRGRFTDKLPLNYLYCGLIRRALPRAKIVHVTRHPLAACYAIYKTLFKDAYPFSYDLGELARYYVGYRGLMEHWRRTLPGGIHELSYERLVSDQPGETRRLLEYCELDWHDACLDFHRNASPVMTASAAQVRQPLYGSSLEQWRHYEGQLAGLRAQLQAAGVADAA